MSELQLDEIYTPALVLDLDAAQRNIAKMADSLRAAGTKHRPHTKAHKSPELARRQIEAGAIGITVATVGEATAMIDHGIDDVLIANEIVGYGKAEAVAEAASRAAVTVAVDSPAAVRTLERATEAVGSEVGVLVEVDIGMGRCGTRTVEELLGVVKAVEASTLRFRGLMAWEGHVMASSSRQEGDEKARSAVELLLRAADELEAQSHTVEVISAGGTATYETTGRSERVTEIQAGSYVLMDGLHRLFVDDFEQAAFVVGTVLARHDDLVVLDCGRKAISANRVPPTLPFPSELRFLNEEHAGFTVPSNSPLRLGDTVLLTPGYAPDSVNLFSQYQVVSDGVIVDEWPVVGRHGERRDKRRTSVR